MLEIMITIVLMGIVFAIASSTWFGIVEGRAVDSAANQLASDMRLAHTSATNRLAQWRVTLRASSSTYTVGPVGSPETRTLPDDTRTGVAVTYTFNADGTVSGSPTTFAISSTDGDPDHDIELSTATSRVRIVD